MERKEFNVQDVAGNAIRGASVLVKTYPGGVNATLYADDGVTPIANPLTTDSTGQAYAKAANGHYSKTVSKTGITTETTNDIIFFDPTDADAALAAPTGSGLVGFSHDEVYPDGTLGAKGQQIVNISDEPFEAVGDGVTDETAKLIAFWNSAIANPGVPHYLNVANYAISAALPVVNVSNVIIRGAGASIHDVVSVTSGTVITWIGGAGSTMAEISSVTGGGNQKISNIELSGIAFNARNLASTGVLIKSVKSSLIDIAVVDGASNGMILDVVSSLGEAADLQGCQIRYRGRQIIAASGVSLRLKGDSSANISFNEFDVDIQHSNAVAVVEENADNNDWLQFRAFRAGGGTATESIQWLGAATALEACRQERFRLLSTTVAARAYGTGTYAVAATSIRIDSLDTTNGTPTPVVDTGASVFWNQATTPYGDTPWVSYTPVITSFAGTITSASAVGSYLQRGRVVDVRIVITITTNGTGATALLATLPITAVQSGVGAGKENALTSKMVSGLCNGSSMTLVFYDGTYPGADGHVITVSARYRI